MTNKPTRTTGRSNVSRRRFLQVSSSGAVMVSALGASSVIPGMASAEAGYDKTFTWISPRGTLEVMDDYAYWVAKEMGYFGDLDIAIEAGPSDGTATVKFVAVGQADMGFPSPGILSFALEADMDLVSVYNVGAVDVFNFAFRKGEGVKNLKDLEGKTILLGSSAWQGITDPMFAAAGVDISKITYLEAGWPQWGTILASGEGDAALAWEGLRADWQGKGLEFEYWLGQNSSKFPANVFVARRSDFEDPQRREFLEKYLRGWAMGMEFAHQNPLAAADIVFKQFPIVKKNLGAELGVESLLQLAAVFRGDMSTRQGWGWHDMDKWNLFFDTLSEIGQVKKPVDVGLVIKNDLVAAANDFDSAGVKADADGYATSDDVASVDLAVLKARFFDNEVK